MTESVQNSFLGSAPEAWLVGVADPYDSGPAYEWKVSMSFSAAAARLKGLVNGTFRGVEVRTRKLEAVVRSAVFAGLSGALYAYYVGYISPVSFSFDQSIYFIIMVVLGGSATTLQTGLRESR